ncbi:hypothetical protein [Hominenteromicrobium sp.]|uniref:hypothetical protein n=1 Tax=Hominenteromicrobium sp. TaxID=3073581 RepID=UPI00399ACA6F
MLKHFLKITLLFTANGSSAAVSCAVDATERANREKAGRLACLLAARADCVVQMFCGIPTVLKGELPK